MALNKIVKNAVIAIGNFDGVHKGHQSIFKLGKKLQNVINRNLELLPLLPYLMNFFKKIKKLFV